jgi:putative RecB family exonuclease
VSAVYSHSGLSAFENCPRQFQYRYVLKVEVTTESVEAFLGKLVHEVLERLYRFVAEGRVPKLAQVLSRYEQWWQERLDPARVRIVRSEVPIGAYRETGLRCLTNYYRSRYPFDSEETLGLEEMVHFSLDASGHYRMRGVIDRIARARDGALEIHDYKTGKRVPSQARIDEDRQLALYQLGVVERFGQDAPVRLVWHYVASNVLRTSTRSPEQLAALRQTTIRLIDRVESETEFPPRPSALCGWCEYREICPASGATARPRVEALAPAAPAQASGGSAPIGAPWRVPPIVRD